MPRLTEQEQREKCLTSRDSPVKQAEQAKPSRDPDGSGDSPLTAKAIGSIPVLRDRLSQAFHGLTLKGVNKVVKKGLIAYVESTNFDSLKSTTRMGYKAFGSVIVMNVLGRYFQYATPGCEPFGFQIEPLSSTTPANRHAD